MHADAGEIIYQFTEHPQETAIELNIDETAA
jgi:hypothetical protein